MQDQTSRTQTPPKRLTLSPLSVNERAFLSQLTWAQDTVSMHFGRWRVSFSLNNGVDTQPDLNAYVKEKGFTLIPHVRLTWRRYYVLPEPTIESMIANEVSRSVALPGRTGSNFLRGC